MLINNAEIYQRGHGSVRIEQGNITDIGALSPQTGERTVDAAGGLLLPGLNDHHLHLMSLAAARDSVPCGPPHSNTEQDLIAALQAAQQDDQRGWLRGVGYHESVAGDIDRAWLDQQIPDRPARIQHRSGRMWIVNSPALAEIHAALKQLPHSQRPHATDDGRLFDMDPALHLLRDATMPPVHETSAELASYGITGFTDMTPSNSAATLARFAKLQHDGQLRQHVRLAGLPDLVANDRAPATSRLSPSLNPSLNPNLKIGATKVHLHEAHLPSFEDFCATLSTSHQQGREVAVHCVTEVELVFTLAAFRAAGVHTGDRIEHASVTPPSLLEQIAELGLIVVTQPHFVSERGDAYLADIAPGEHAWLYRAQSFLSHNIALAGGSDAPFGHGDPWRAMRAAVTRRTASNQPLGELEGLSPEQALNLFLGSLPAPAQPRRIAPGAPADLCLLDCPWAVARRELSSIHVRATLRGGELIFDRVDQAPG